VKASEWTQQAGVGVLPWMGGLPLWLKVVAGLLVLDLIGAWLIHFLEHKVKWMWQLHLVHHSDTLVDVTTALRHHPGESVLRAVFTLLAVLVAGAPMGIVMLYQSLSALFSQFNHANMKLPVWMDRVLSWVIVSPNMHKIHHHFELPYTDSNYGNLFAFWDRLFGTYQEMDAAAIQYGLDTHPELKAEEPIGHLLKMPFEPYRPTPEKK
jgi:sterol desaturase/sphingolipid hydroxylase (fatty acid hydroxylase superfamily)